MKLIAGLSIFLVGIAPAQAGGRKKPSEPTPVASENGKRVLRLDPLGSLEIELPDESFFELGSGFHALLTRKLSETGRFTMSSDDQPVSKSMGLLEAESVFGAVPQYVWNGSVVPAARIRVSVEAMTFSSGSKGTKMSYGFDERFRTPFNDGSRAGLNEFPMRTVKFEPNWFDRAFDAKGSSMEGLDLGDGIQIDALFAFLSLKYVRYQSRLALRFDLDAPLVGRHEFRTVQVKGRGYHYDLAGLYGSYSLGIRIAQKDAMLQAMNRALEGSVDTLTQALDGLPAVAQIDGIRKKDGKTYILLGTGPDAGLPVGTLFEVLGGKGPVKLRLLVNASSGGIAELAEGEASQLTPGLYVREALAGLPPAELDQDSGRMTMKSADARIQTAHDDVELAEANFGRPQFAPGEAPKESRFTAIWRSITLLYKLAGRIARYQQYDQTYKASPDGDASRSFHERIREKAWAKKIGLDQVAHLTGGRDDSSSPIVAVVDTGVDYNHPAIHGNLWVNSVAETDPSGRQDRYGWDFISGDSRPYDDAYRGTQVASAVLAVAPHARILPIKAFNPWGVTGSAAIYGSFQYAIGKGAKIIVCAWATRKPSAALEQAIRLATENGVLVVAAAGDRGDDLKTVPAFPASLAARYPNVLTVAATSENDELVQVKARYSNFGTGFARIAAPGKDVDVAEPRGRYAQETGTAIAAGLVAGAAARIQVARPDAGAEVWIQELLDSADRVPALEGRIEGARRLRVR